MKTISLKLEESLDERVAALAAQREVSKSAVIRAALEAYVRNETPSRARPGSALDLAGDLVGCLEGPGDLSFNPAHMDGFGR